MPRPYRLVIWTGALLLLFIVALVFTPYPTYMRLGSYVINHPNQTVFTGNDYIQMSAVKHSDEGNWDLVAREYQPAYWSSKPNNCTLDGKDDLFFSLTGIWFARWRCHP